jgi:hypothetical protein
MTGDDLVKVIMAGTGAAATLYTIAHNTKNPSLMQQTVGADLGTTVYNPYNPAGSASAGNVLLVGALLVGAFLVLRK